MSDAKSHFCASAKTCVEIEINLSYTTTSKTNKIINYVCFRLLSLSLSLSTLFLLPCCLSIICWKFMYFFCNAKLSHSNFQLKNSTPWQLFLKFKTYFDAKLGRLLHKYILLRISYLHHLKKMKIFCVLIIQWNSRYPTKKCCCFFLEWQKSVTTLKSYMK